MKQNEYLAFLTDYGYILPRLKRMALSMLACINFLPREGITRGSAFST